MRFRKTAEIKAKAIFSAKFVVLKKTSPYHNAVEIRGELSIGSFVKLEKKKTQQSCVPHFCDVITLIFNKFGPRVRNNLIKRYYNILAAT